VLLSGERAKNARSISLPSLRQNYLVAMATSLDKLENKAQVHHLHIKRFDMVKRFRKAVSISGDFRLYTAVFGGVVPEVHKKALSSLKLPCKSRGVDPYGTGATCPPNIYEGGTSMVMSPPIF